jgi:uroporphyrinogen decarboxylase
MMKKLLNTLQGHHHASPPLWLMRQAGRYLPEYRALRTQAGSFLNLCFNPELAAEVTLQPIQRFDFDAAIIFADILLIPHALGRNLTFTTGEGPKLDPLKNSHELIHQTIGTQLDAVYAALRLVKNQLPADKTLIGFCGAPFTVACYMISGGGSNDFSAVTTYAKNDRADFIKILHQLADISIDYLCQQIAAGADTVQIFESWAGLVAAEDWQDFVLIPTQRIVFGVKKHYPQTPFIGFPRGAQKLYHHYAKNTGVQAIGLDQTIDLNFAAELQNETIIQGNLAPEILVQGGQAQANAVRAIKTALGRKPFIFNLGHGITPDTPIAHVHELIKQVRQT